MNHRIASALILLILASSADAFSTVSKANSFLGSTTATTTSSRSHQFQKQQQLHVQQNEFGSASRGAANACATSLHMAATPVAGAIAGAITGGFFAGGLHAIAGEFFRHKLCFTARKIVTPDVRQTASTLHH